MPWVFDAKELRYKNSDTGKVLSPEDVEEINERSIAIGLEKVDILVDNLIKGDLPVREFRENLLQTAKEARIRAFLLGRGGRNATFISEMVAFMKKTVRVAGESALNFESMLNSYSESEIRKRARLYILGARAEFYASSRFDNGVFTKIKAAEDFPFMPGHCSYCNGNCRCEWEVVGEDERDGQSGVLYRWVTAGDDRVCPLCEQRDGAEHFVPENPGILRRIANTFIGRG